MEKPSRLAILPCDASDLGTQKCRLGPSLMDSIGAGLDSPLKITAPQGVYICHAWPRRDQCEGYVQLSETVSTTTHHTAQLEGTSNNKDLIDSNCIKVLTAEKLASVETLLVVSDYVKVASLRDSADIVSSYVCNILQGFTVMKNYTVNCTEHPLGRLYGFTYIVVNDTGNVEAGTVCKNTKVTVADVMSIDRYQQKMKSTEILLGGLDVPAKQLKEIISLPFQYPEDFKKLGLECPKGVLLRGPPGCGKTSLVKAVANQCEAFLISINGPELFGARPGESEENLRNIFRRATSLAKEGPCVLFIDEIDTLCPKRGKSGSVQDSRLVAQLLTLMDGLESRGTLVVIGATNRANAIDPALRRPGRFDREIVISVPTQRQRVEILRVQCECLPLVEDVDIADLADLTAGYVGADLVHLCHEASYLAITASNTHKSEPGVSMADFRAALSRITPSTQRGSEANVDHRPVAWEDIGGLEQVKQQLKQAVEWPMRHSDSFARLGLPRPRGVLLYGPPGCCKTMLVRAAATACHATFLSISGAQLFSPYVGDSEKALAELFHQARMGAPSIVFIDEIDSIIGKRSESSKQRGVQERLLSTLLNEMDGIGVKLEDSTQPNKTLLEGVPQENTDSHTQEDESVDNRDVLLVAATNRPDLLDDALLRPGRIDRIIYVPPPDLKARDEILKIHSRGMPLASGVDLAELAEQTEGFTGAELENMCREAALQALTEEGLDAMEVSQEHFWTVREKTCPSLTPQELENYSRLKPANTHASLVS